MPTHRLPTQSPVDSLQFKQGALISALIAMLIVTLLRLEHHRSAMVVWFETGFLCLVPVLLFLLLQRWQRMAPERFGHRRLMLTTQGVAALMLFLTLVAQAVSRSMGHGDANEFVTLQCLQVISWCLAVFASVRGFEKGSFAFCGAVVFFVCCTTQNYSIFVLSSFFAVSALWWMAGLYWSRLDSKAIDGSPKMMAIHGTTTLVSAALIALVIGVAALTPLSRGQISITGFMPFSGGENGDQDPFANSGIGDGEMLAAGRSATTTGAVDSDQFIEDHKPSMYDMMSETYDGPIAKRRRNRAVPLSEQARHIHDLKQSEQSGRTFRTMRETSPQPDRDYENRITEALFFIEGSVPVRLINSTFEHFDGWDWTKSSTAKFPPMQAKIQLRTIGEKPIFSLAQMQADYLPASRQHKVKIMRLESPALPAPSFLDQWHIAYVNRVDFFDWNEGVIKYDGELIPPQTVIDTQSYVPNFHTLRSKRFPGHYGTSIPDPDSPYRQIPDNSTRSRIDALAIEFTQGIEPGWKQVEAIVRQMNERFEPNRRWETDEFAEDTIGHFLDQREGPSWMFATTCTMILRSAGYRTRMSNGFLVREEDYDSKSRQSIVTSENLHMWPEVCLDGRFWIPVEPTPGYPTPYDTQTLWQWFSATVAIIFHWIWTRPIVSLLSATGVVLVYRLRGEIAVWLMLLWWHLVRYCWPKRLVKTTQQLLDFRFRIAGDRRPRAKTIRDWYARVEPQLPNDFFEAWNAENYRSTKLQHSNSELAAKCRELLEKINLRNIRRFAADQSAQEREAL